MIVHTTAARPIFIFDYLCNPDVFDDGDDPQLQCVDDLLDTLMTSGSTDDGKLYIKNDCDGLPVYGYRWMDADQAKATECLKQAKDVIKDTCYHRKGARVSNSATCQMRFELSPFQPGV
ncbi:unnamed protein product [Linum trigynum]|uniref:Gnk2-homologous domain-containing protein n=1 Tax=Linum trigynum TaxID=586398 RepID=A0AAV2FQH5_9ROSI